MTRLTLPVFIALTAACASFPSVTQTADSILPLKGIAGTCTAWSAGPGQWVTAKHCLTVGGLDGWTIHGQPASVIAQDSLMDVALLSGPVAPSLPVAPSDPPVGAALVVYGFGLNQRLLMHFSVRLMAVASDFFDADDGLQMIVSGANGMPGMSGGPILYRGRVVGQVSGGGWPTEHTQLIGSGVTGAGLRRFLREHLNVPRWGTD